MYVSRVRLRNVRGFHGGREVDLDLRRPDGSHAGWTVLAGRNGSGKTSLLRAIALAISGPSVARNLVSDFENWVSVGQREAIADVMLTFDPAERFATERPPTSEFWAGLRWMAPDETRNRPGRRRAQPLLDHHIDSTNPFAAKRGPWQGNPEGWFCAGYGPFRRLVGGTGEAQRLMLTSGPVARMASLFHEDASLAEGVRWLITQHLRALEGHAGAAYQGHGAARPRRWVAPGRLPDRFGRLGRTLGGQ